MSPEDARSFWITEPGRGEIREEVLRSAEPGDAIVRTLYTGISRGTETLVFAGAVPASERERMRAPFQVGDFPAPVKYGYNNVGIVESGPAALVGRNVFCLFPHQTRYVVPAGALHVLPAGVPPARAVLAANLETAVNGLWDLGPRVGDRIAVVGAGTVGCLVAWLAARTAGAEVQLVDVDPRKRAVATELGVAFAPAGEAARDVDLVVHASGTEAGLEQALELAGFESTVLELSWYGARRPAVPLGESFHSRRLTLRSSQVGNVAASQRARWSTARRMELVLRLLASPTLDALISGESAFEELPRVLARLGSPSEYTLCHRIRYS
ncbi:MAG TPA: zinc-binding alcohol dehydrogenase [Gammaproteobacteria bacterium]|nr:zinc-binding alcohol dehydrogenase [Gammaproteobacteria bacterium]